MHTKRGPEIPPDVLAQMGYETRDVIGQTLVRWLAVLVVLIAAFILGTLALYNVFVPNTAKLVYGKKPTYLLNRVPPNPQLQVDAKREMADFRRAEYVWENRTFYTDESKTKVNIPVETAMERLAAQGIAGVKETNKPARERSYPGSGDFRKAELSTAEDTAPGDVTNPSVSANALGEGEGLAGDRSDGK